MKMFLNCLNILFVYICQKGYYYISDIDVSTKNITKMNLMLE